MPAISIAFTVDAAGAQHAGQIRLVDAVAIERRFNVSIANIAVWPLDWVLYGAWHALKRVGNIADVDYDDWLAGVDGVDLGDEDADSPKSEVKARLREA